MLTFKGVKEISRYLRKDHHSRPLRPGMELCVLFVKVCAVLWSSEVGPSPSRKVNFIWAERTGRPGFPNTFQRDQTPSCLGKTSRADVFTAAQQLVFPWPLPNTAVHCRLSSLLGSRRWTTAGRRPRGHHPWWTRRPLRSAGG